VYALLVRRSLEDGCIVVDVFQIDGHGDVRAQTRRAQVSRSHRQLQRPYEDLPVALVDGQSLVVQRTSGCDDAASRVDRKIPRELTRQQGINYLAVSRSCKRKASVAWKCIIKQKELAKISLRAI